VQTQNHNKPVNEIFPTNSAVMQAAAEEAHFYAECSNMGKCNRQTGECSCVVGYTGHACQRQVCPNSCSGHGVCKTLAQIAAGALNMRETGAVALGIQYSGVTEEFEYRSWDADMSRSCVCDAGYAGNDCSERECPRGDDPMTKDRRTCGGESCRNQMQQLRVSGATSVTEGHTAYGANLVLKYLHYDGDWYETAPYELYPGSSTRNAKVIAIKHWLKTALEGLPNQAIDEVAVTCLDTTTGDACVDETADGDAAIDAVFSVEFIRPTGMLHPLQLEFRTINDAPTVVAETHIELLDVDALQVGNKERVVCSNRGKCNSATGQCSCFSGYAGYDCSEQNALGRKK
jgi:hypothetical protein